MKMAVVIMDSGMDVGAGPFSPDHSDEYTDGNFPAYLLPNDEQENDRLDMFHELCLQLMHRRLYLAPIEKPQRVIDLGTGTGIWAIDFGKLSGFFPSQDTDTHSCSGLTSSG